MAPIIYITSFSAHRDADGYAKLVAPVVLRGEATTAAELLTEAATLSGLADYLVIADGRPVTAASPLPEIVFVINGAHGARILAGKVLADIAAVEASRKRVALRDSKRTAREVAHEVAPGSLAFPITISYGGNKRETYLVDAHFTIGDVLAQIHLKQGLSPSSYRLCYKADSLDNDDTLFSYKIRAGDELDCFQQQSGGMYHSSSGRRPDGSVACCCGEERCALVTPEAVRLHMQTLVKLSAELAAPGADRARIAAAAGFEL
jgi:hypothetical protein